MVDSEFWLAARRRPQLPAVVMDGAPGDVAELVSQALPAPERRLTPAEMLVPDRTSLKIQGMKNAFMVFAMNGFSISRSEWGFEVTPPEGLSKEQTSDVYRRAQMAMSSFGF